MLYKQAWQELKDYLNEPRWLPSRTQTGEDALFSNQHELMCQNILAKMRSLEDRWKIMPVKKRNMEGKRYRHPRLGIVQVIMQPGYTKGAPRNVLIRLKYGHETIVPQRSLRKIKEEIEV